MRRDFVCDDIFSYAGNSGVGDDGESFRKSHRGKEDRICDLGIWTGKADSACRFFNLSGGRENSGIRENSGGGENGKWKLPENRKL